MVSPPSKAGAAGMGRKEERKQNMIRISNCDS